MINVEERINEAKCKELICSTKACLISRGYEVEGHDIDGEYVIIHFNRWGFKSDLKFKPKDYIE